MIRRLCEAIAFKKAPVVVGLDPALSMIPEDVLQEAYEAYGETLEGAAQAILTFNKELIDHLYDIVPAVKPQIAMYERYGYEGVRVYAETISYAREKGLLIIGDIKRGDIGSTAQAYADGHMGSVQVGSRCYTPFAEDFSTVNAYLGSDGVKPFIDVCNREDKGIFVLVKTSNPASGELQDLTLSESGMRVYEQMAAYVSAWGLESMDGDYSNVGAVAGATYPEVGARLRELMPHTFFLVPGYGAQGATAEDLKPFFKADGTGAIINSSRGIIAAWQKEQYASLRDTAHPVGEAARKAAQDMIKELQDITGGN